MEGMEVVPIMPLHSSVHDLGLSPLSDSNFGHYSIHTPDPAFV